MTFTIDRVNRGETRKRLFSNVLGRIAAWLDDARSRGHRAGSTVIAPDETPEHKLRDIGLLDGRQVIPLRQDGGWR